MKILFNNEFEEGTVLATNESLNYPVVNLSHPFLKKRFQSTTTSSLVTYTFTEDMCFSCLFFGYHDVDNAVAVFKNIGGSTLDTITIPTLLDIHVENFAEIQSVRSVEITLNGLSGFYIGGIGGGCCYSMPDPNADYDHGNIDNSSFTGSPDGQTLQNYIKPLRDLPYTFREIEPSTAREIDELIKSVGSGKALYFDLYEDDRSKEPPIYGYFPNAVNFPYSPRRHTFNIRILEAR